MATLIEQLTQAEQDLKKAKQDRDDNKHQADIIYQNYNSCVNFYNTPQDVDSCWAPYKSSFDNYVQIINSLNGKITTLESTITSLNAAIKNDPNSQVIIAAGAQSQKTKRVIIWIVAIIIILLILTWIYIKYIRKNK